MNRQNDNPASRRRAGFTLVELIFTIIFLALIVAILLPSTRRAKEASGRTQCNNNMKQLGIALHGYHDTYGHFPPAIIGDPSEGVFPEKDEKRHSGVMKLLPFLEMGPMWDKISQPNSWNGISYPAMGAAPWDPAYPPWREDLKFLRCPSDNSPRTSFGRTNYAFCIGDLVNDLHQPAKLRGVFGGRLTSQLKDIKDGTSNTIAMGEIGNASGRKVIGQLAIRQSPDILKNPQLCLGTLNPSKRAEYAKNAPLSGLGRGGRWADGAAGISMFQTILPPGGPSCSTGDSEAADGIYSAGSHHPGIVQVLLVDGSCRQIPTDIDAGNSPSRTQHRGDSMRRVHPQGIWGALGTMQGDEAMPGEIE